MTATEKRIIIAEWEGWRRGPVHFGGFCSHKWTSKDGATYYEPPIYNLVEIHRVKARLTDDQWLRFQEHLTDVTGARHADGKSRSFVNLRRLMCATAEEQCDALVRMIKEETK